MVHVPCLHMLQTKSKSIINVIEGTQNYDCYPECTFKGTIHKLRHTLGEGWEQEEKLKYVSRSDKNPVLLKIILNGNIKFLKTDGFKFSGVGGKDFSQI